MLTSKELRQKAWDSLKGRYWLAFLACIIVGLVVSVGTGFIGYAEQMMGITKAVPASEFDADEILRTGAIVIAAMSFGVTVVGIIISALVSGPMEIGGYKYFIENTEKKPELGVVFSGFKIKYGRNVGAIILMVIKEFLWTLLFIIPGIIKAFEYAIIPYILADDADITTKDAFKKAKVMMTGNKWRLFKLNFSFIGWLLLCGLTLGIGTFFLLPYIEAANAEFYVELKNKQ